LSLEDDEGTAPDDDVGGGAWSCVASLPRTALLRAARRARDAAVGFCGGLVHAHTTAYAP
jgi:hypothetical protein